MLTYVPPFKVIARDEMLFLTFTLKFTCLSEVLRLVLKTKTCKKSQAFQTLKQHQGSKREKEEREKQNNNNNKKAYKDRHLPKGMV